MNIRTTFTIWIALASFSAALIFSSFIYIELGEEHQKMIKREIVDIKEAICQNISSAGGISFAPTSTDYPLDRYYVQLVTGDGEIVYQSRIARYLDIPPQPKDGFFTVVRPLPAGIVRRGPWDGDDNGEIGGGSFRFSALQDTREVGDGRFILTVAKPLVLLTEELRELFGELIVSILLATFSVFCLSYFLAGRLLAPLTKINENIESIRENSLDGRIPLGKSRDELDTLSRALNAMFDRLQFSFARQRDFLASAAHELKIPLTIIMLSQEEMMTKKLPVELKDELQAQLTSLYRLNRLVKDLLDISILEHKEFCKLQEIDLSAMLSEVLAGFTDMLQAAGITCYHAKKQIFIMGDNHELTKAFINLFDNAIKYNLAEDGSIQVTAKKIGPAAEVRISNSSMEIPVPELSRIFTQFYRVEKSRSSKYGGSGLGLVIVKRIIELHGGTITATNALGRTTFIITLPLARV